MQASPDLVWRKTKNQKHTTTCVRWSSPTQLLSDRFVAYLCEIERDREFSTIYGRMYSQLFFNAIYFTHYNLCAMDDNGVMTQSKRIFYDL